MKFSQSTVDNKGEFIISEHQQIQQSKYLKPSSQKRTIPASQNDVSNPAAIIQRARIDPKSLTSADVLQLQRTIGNRAVGRLLSEIRNPSTVQLVPIQRQEIPEEEEPLQDKMAETVQRQEMPEEEEPLQTKKENNTGMPDNLKAGVESLSGIDLSNVRVHYNSSKPAEVGALAYTQGMNIHVAPGQERHLSHEAWHVVQQAQGMVRPTMQLKDGIPVNDDKGLEHEADEMGERAIELNLPTEFPFRFRNLCNQVPLTNTLSITQCRFWNCEMNVVEWEQIVRMMIPNPDLGSKSRIIEQMRDSDIDYIFPEEHSKYADSLLKWVNDWESSCNGINVDKMIKIVNSILKNGILNKKDRDSKLEDSNRSSTSVDSTKGSNDVHGMVVSDFMGAVAAKKTSINILSEVRDDPFISGTVTRIKNGLLTRKERDFLIEKQMNYIDAMTNFNGKFTSFKDKLLKEGNNQNIVRFEGFSSMGEIYKSVVSFAVNEIFGSSVGQSELKRRLSSGFMCIVDWDKVSKKNYSPHNGEGTSIDSIDPTNILKLVLPSVLKSHQEEIINPHNIPIVYLEPIKLDDSSEISLYTQNSGIITLKSPIDLNLESEISETRLDKCPNSSVFTHMVRGF